MENDTFEIGDYIFFIGDYDYYKNKTMIGTVTKKDKKQLSVKVIYYIEPSTSTKPKALIRNSTLNIPTILKLKKLKKGKSKNIHKMNEHELRKLKNIELLYELEKWN